MQSWVSWEQGAHHSSSHGTYWLREQDRSLRSTADLHCLDCTRGGNHDSVPILMLLKVFRVVWSLSTHSEVGMFDLPNDKLIMRISKKLWIWNNAQTLKLCKNVHYNCFACLCVFVYMYECLYVCGHMDVEAQGWYHVSSLIPLYILSYY